MKQILTNGQDPPELSELRLVQRRYGAFLAICAGYLSLHAAGRWFFYVIFRGHGATGWSAPGYADYAHLLISTALPFFALAALVYLIAARWVKSVRAIVLTAIAVYFFTLILELDMTWFAMSKRHVGLAEVGIFLFEDWRQTLGLKTSDFLRFGRIAAAHALIYGLLAVLVVQWPRGGSTLWQVSPKRLAMLSVGVIFLAALDTGAVASAFADERENVQRVRFEERHPLRSIELSRLIGRLIDITDAVSEVNARLAKTNAAPAGAENPISSQISYEGPSRPNIVFLVIEGLNANLAREQPVFSRLRGESIVGEQHFSTGDATQYGIIGITHGAPVLFYGAKKKPQSAYVDALNRAGYRTRRFGVDVGSFAEMNDYTANFTEPTFEPKDSTELFQELRSYLADTTRPNMAVVYYSWTHWPYIHDRRFSRHLPEIPSDFDFARWDVRDYETQIRNRYLNCLDEMNDWLERFLPTVDRSKTILVITGDHGEEMFEFGRMTHSSGVWDLQIRVPMNILLPGNAPGELRGVTSHAHLFPAIAKFIGLEVKRELQAYDGPVALAAHTNYVSFPREWALVTAGAKFSFDMSQQGKIDIKTVTNLADESILPMTPENTPAIDHGLRILKALSHDLAGKKVATVSGIPSS